MNEREKSLNALTRFCSDARVGGMLGGKAGLEHVHMGTGKLQLQALYDAMEVYNVPL
jgi:beta-aspartyl-dipeptidase (metallo-type)